MKRFLLAALPLFAEMKSIDKVWNSQDLHMVGDGFRVFNYFPAQSPSLEELSPFVLLDYNEPHYFPPVKNGKRGVGAHPHRGFETVTLVYEGSVAHRDSRSGSGVVHKGGVQWMTAGSGVLHEEFHAPEFSKTGGTFHAVQLWVNLPAKYKMTAPRYQTLADGDMGRKVLDDKGSELRVIAGECLGVKGPAQTFTPVELYDVLLKKGASVSFDLPEGHTCMALVMSGKARLNGKAVETKDLVYFGHQGKTVSLAAEEESFILIMGGEPIREKVIQRGPFVMNTTKEILQAQKDLELGLFGYLD